jgi:molybdopterin-containing oxidoreductase family membrane subunit
MIILNVAVPFTFFSKKLKTNMRWLFIAAILVNIGMWFERFIIIVTSLSHDFLPSSWGLYTPRLVEMAITVGSFGLFVGAFMIFVKLFPSVPMSELKETIISQQERQ